MAVKYIKRKRKYEEISLSAKERMKKDEGELAVPKKQAKCSNSPIKEKQKKHQRKVVEQINGQQALQQQQNGEMHDQEMEINYIAMEQAPAIENDQEEEVSEMVAEAANGPATEPKIEFSKDFKMLDFRNKLRGTDFIRELRHFLHLCSSTKSKIIAKYIEKRGKPLEIALALERIDKTNLLHIAYICEALQLVIMEILSNQNQLMESAVNACRYFFKTHTAIIGELLKSEQVKHRCIALKLLSAIVCVDPQFGRQALSSYNILTNVNEVQTLAAHTKLDVHSKDSVRKCFIHFVLAYLIDGNTLLIRNIIDQGYLIRILVKGLYYDDHVTVCLVLNTLRKYVLESPEISKTKKVHVFDVECCKHITRLYDWLGPKGLVVENGDKCTDNINAEVIESVVSAAHEFLCILLTSRKYGITFDAITHFRQKYNSIQGKVIGSIYRPYLNARKTELIVKTLQACPDLMRRTVRNYASIINPLRINNKQQTAEALNFLAEIIAAVPPQLLGGAMDKMTLTDFRYWIIEVCLPIEALTFITSSHYLKQVDFKTRLATNRLLVSMMTQYANYVQAVTKREQAKRAQNSLKSFKFDLFNHLLLHFPTIEAVLQSLHMSIQDQMNDDCDVLEHLSVTLDLILIICNENRSFVYKTSQILDYLDMLRPLYETNFAIDAETEQNISHLKLELKTVKIILLLYPHALQPDSQLFEKVLHSFIRAYLYADSELQGEAGNLLHGIFKNTGIFDTCTYEIDLWLEALRFFDAEIVQDMTAIFVQIFKVKDSEVQMPTLNNAEQTGNLANLHKIFEQIQNGLSVQASVETVSISKFLPLIFKGVELSEPYLEYLELVCLLIFHYYPKPSYVLKLCRTHLTNLLPYMQSWLSQKKIEDKRKKIKSHLAARMPLVKRLQEALLNGTQKFEITFAADQSDNYFELEIDGSVQRLHGTLRNQRLIMIYVQEIIFVLAQLVALQQLSKDHADIAANYLIKLFQVMDKQLITTETHIVETIEENYLNLLLHYIYAIRLIYVQSNEQFTADNETQLNYVHFLRLLTEYCKQLPNFDQYATNYRFKIVKSVAISLNNVEQTKAASDKLSEIVFLIEAFNLTADNSLDILNLLTSQLKYNDFFMEAKTTIYFDLLVCMLKRLTNLQEVINCSSVTKILLNYYKNWHKQINKGVDMQLEQFELALYNFLLCYHQQLAHCDAEIFKDFFEMRKLSKASIKLACLMLERNAIGLQETFNSLLPQHIDKKELIYPLLNIAFMHNFTIEVKVLHSVYQVYKTGFMKSIEKTQKAAVIYKENPICSIELVKHCMPKSECIDFCHKNLKFDATEIYQLRLIQAIYVEAFEATIATKEQKVNIVISFINMLVQMLSIDLKKQFVDQHKLELYAWYCYNWLQLETEQQLLDFNKLLTSQQWMNFCKNCLKLSMCSNELENASQQADQRNGLLLQLLSYLCDKLFADYNAANTTATDATASVAVALFEMICSHSRCLDILLAVSRQPTQVKTYLLRLMYILAKKAPQVLQINQIPIILGAYQARLTAADRYALALLELYEQYDVGLERYRPFIWGESAIAFYALRNDDERADLQYQETSIMQVMSLIDKQVCLYTIDNFPIWRSLHSTQQLPELHFKNPDIKAISFGANSLEQRIELGTTKFDVHELRLCPKSAGIYEKCYDPAFFVSLMSYCFAPGSYIHAARPIENGLLALVFTALASQDKDMRLAAACCQQRYCAHFEQAKFSDKPLWQQIYNNIQAGLTDLRDMWMQHRGNSGTPRAPLIPVLFIAKTLNMTTEPTNLLYKQLIMYLRLKSSFNFQTIPEFNVLFYSDQVEHKEYRRFIVEVIRNGIKCSTDLFQLLSTNTFKVLMGFYGSSMSTLDMNLLILSLFSTCVKIPGSAKIVIENIGILPWLSSIICNTEFYHFDIIEGLISIINNLWYALKANAKFDNCDYLELNIYKLLLQLQPLLSPRISLSNFAKYLNILQKTACEQHQKMIAQNLDNLLNCAAQHLAATHMHGLRCIRQFGGVGAETNRAYCERLRQLQPLENLDDNSVLALSSLRAFVIDWWQGSISSQGYIQTFNTT